MSLSWSVCAGIAGDTGLKTAFTPFGRVRVSQSVRPKVAVAVGLVTSGSSGIAMILGDRPSAVVARNVPSAEVLHPSERGAKTRNGPARNPGPGRRLSFAPL